MNYMTLPCSVRHVFNTLVCLLCILVFIFLSCSSSHPEDIGSFQPEKYFSTYDYDNEQGLYDGVLEYPPGAAFIAGRYVELYLHDELSPKAFYLLSLEHDPMPYRLQSAMHLLALLHEMEDSEIALQFARRVDESGLSQVEVRRALAAFYYDNEFDEYLLPVLRHMDEQYNLSQRDPEVLLWAIVADMRNGSGIPHESLHYLNSSFRAHDVHWRLERYIQFRPDLRELMLPDNMRLLQVKAAISQQQYRGAIREFFSLVEEGMSNSLLWDVYSAAIQRGDRYGAAILLQDFAQKTESRGLEITAWELAGRLLALGGQHSAAQTAFSQGISLVEQSDTRSIAGVQGQRMVWNWWRSGIRTGSDTALLQVQQLSEWIENPGYFNDILNDFISQLIREQRWLSLEQLYVDLEGKLSVPLQARFAWVLAELQRLGFLDERVASRQDFLQRAATQDHDPYYRFAAQLALQQRPELPLLAMTPQIPVGVVDHEESIYLQWVDQLYRAGLLEDAYLLKHRYADLFSVTQLNDYVSLHYDVGRYIEGMRLVDRWLRVQPEPPSGLGEDFMRMRYPLAFKEEMAEVIDRYDLQSALFYGLVREESYFDAEIRSHVGATGLAQLMPATAQDMIQLLRLRDPDLSDPLTNLSIGSYYYRRLLNRFDLPVLALVAYNAGQGRVNTWRHEPWTQSLILFHEGLPFEETRHYIRKIMVSAAHYQELYFDGSAEDVFFHIFPDFDPYTEQ